MKDLRCGIGNELWINLPKERRDKVRKATGDAVAPCGFIGFKMAIHKCTAGINTLMCRACKGAK